MHEHSQHQPHDKHAGHSPEMFKQKFWLSLVLAVPTLLFSDTVQGWLHINWHFTGSTYIPAVFGTIIFFYGGLVFLKGAQYELAQRLPGMMTLISMAITVAFGYSIAVTLRLTMGMDFWWELATLITIMLLGHWLEMASIMSAQGALHELAKLLPDTAERLTKDGTQTIPLGELKSGDSILIRPGTKIPADGTITKGESSVNESMITGESKPVAKKPKAQVIAGTINGSGALTVTVANVGEGTMLAGIMRLVAEAQNSKSKTQLLADKAAFYLTLLALGAAIITAIAWAIAGQSAAFITARVVTVLVVACPHALGLAIPLVTAIATTRAAQNGLLVRQRSALETAHNVNVVLFDKTGTLTTGQQGVVDIIAQDKDKLLALAAAVEAQSEHPIAHAITRTAQKQKIKVPKSHKFLSLPGRGAKATIAGTETYVGGPALLKKLRITPSEELIQTTKHASSEGKSAIYVVQKGHILGTIFIADVIRPESYQAVHDLQRAGKRVALLTGDSHGVAAWVAHELKISEAYAEVLPQHKSSTVKRLQAGGQRVAMVGDGVNDAPALTQADIGIAIGAGTDVAIESADIVLATSDPRAIAKIIKLSRATQTKMQQNLAWAIGYNLLAIPLAAGIATGFGFILPPSIGAILMSVSTIIVAINAQLLRRAQL